MRLASGAQSSSPNGVSGVGSTQSHAVGPLHARHAAWHVAQLCPLTPYVPTGQLETQCPPSRRGKTVGGHLLAVQAFGRHAVHCELRGPLHALHVGAHGWHTRAASA